MKEKKFSIKNMTRYFTILKGVRLPWWLIILSCAFGIGMINAELLVATLTADIIDTSQNAINAKELITYIGMVALSAGLSICENYFTRKMEEVITLRVRVKLWKKIMYLPTRYYDVDNGDELITRVTSDASSPASLFTLAISCIVCVITSVQAFLKLFEYNVTLARYSLIIIPLTFIISVVYGKLMFKLGVYSTATMAGSLGYLAERVRNFRLIKSGSWWRDISSPPACSQ